MKIKIYYILFTFLLLQNCSSIQHNRVSQTAPNIPGVSYSGIYITNTGIKAFDQITNRDSLLGDVDGSFFVKALSPNRDKLALAYRTTDSLKVSLITFNPLRLIPISTSNKDNHVILTWKDDNLTLFFNFWNFEKVGERTYPKNVSAHFFDTELMRLHKLIYPMNSAIIKDWIPIGYLVVNYRGTYYLIDIESEKIAFTLGNYKNITFSPDGRYFFYYKDEPTADRFGRIINVPELYLSEFNGTNSKKIVPYNYEPRNAVWSPDGSIIVFDTKSQKRSDIRHLTIFNVDRHSPFFQIESNRARTQPHFSPSGGKLFYYEQDVMQLSIQHMDIDAKVMDIYSQREMIVNSGSSTIPGHPVGGFIGWYDDENLGLSATGWLIIFNTKNRTKTPFPYSGWPLHIWESQTKDLE